MIRSAFISFFFLALILCPPSWAQQETADAAPGKTEIKSETPGLVVARISGLPITESEVLDMIEDLAGQSKMSLEQLRQRNSLLFKDAMNNLISIALLKDQARKQNITVDKALVDQQIQQISKRYNSSEEFQKDLAAQRLTESELRASLEQSIAMQKVIDHAVENVSETTDADIEKFYTENPDKFQLPERVHAAHILLRADRQNTEDQKAEIRKKLDTIRSEIEANTISFAEAAKKYSQDTVTAPGGGDLGTFPRGRVAKVIEDTAFGTKPGTLSPVIETPVGFHVIQTLELRPAGKATLEEVKSSVRQYLDQTAKNRAVQKFVSELKGGATIESFMTAEEFARRHPVE